MDDKTLYIADLDAAHARIIDTLAETAPATPVAARQMPIGGIDTDAGVEIAPTGICVAACRPAHEWRMSEG